MSTNSFGSPDLDLRQTGMARDTMASWLQECPHCLFTARRVGQAGEAERAAAADPSYAGIGHTLPPLAAQFARRAFIDERCGDHAAAAEELLRAAWVLDDLDIDASAIRLQGAGLFDAAIAARPVSQERLLMRIDMLRRAGAFDEAVAAADFVLDAASGPNEQKIARFQRALARQGSVDCYTVDQALHARLTDQCSVSDS